MDGHLKVRATYDLQGTLQGVGFRPAIFRLARRAGLGGWIQNRSGSVRLVLEGDEARIAEFIRRLPAALPQNAVVKSIARIAFDKLPPDHVSAEFNIAPSAPDDQVSVLIPADLAVCPTCAAEVRDPRARRYGYAFTTCTDCGPRYTLLRAMPFDRRHTTMAVFPMCGDCRREYEDPRNRRFHAEIIACPNCGPHPYALDFQGNRTKSDAIRKARAEIARGRIVALRGLGGFQLAVDAFNPAALRILRDRKKRPHKPFAVMARDLATIRQFCRLPPEAATVLTSPAAPIFILEADLQAVQNAGLPLELITPDACTLGVMLPTTPLHHLLLDPLEGDPVPPFALLVMTSGNRRGEPICLSDAEAASRLQGIADLVLSHDRDINLRCDDSVATVQFRGTQLWRRARGYAPQPLSLPVGLKRCVLGMGADFKNTVTLAHDRTAVISPHVGDLDNPEALDALERTVATLLNFLNREPATVAVDLHPDFHSSRAGRRLAAQLGIGTVEVQHHHAHGLACLAENNATDGLILAFDGTGLGPDGSIWGAELLRVSTDTFLRLATFSGVPLPGGDAAVQEPARQLVARWISVGLDVTDAWILKLGLSHEQIKTWTLQCKKNINAPVTHAAGRLFDAFSVLLGAAPKLCTYEGQPAIRLEALARRHSGRIQAQVPFDLVEKNEVLYVDWSRAFEMLADISCLQGREAEWALAFHHAVARAATAMVEYGFDRFREKTVALSGGVFMNKILNELLIPELEKKGFRVLVHKTVPPNDGCISLGQAVAAGSGNS